VCLHSDLLSPSSFVLYCTCIFSLFAFAKTVTRTTQKGKYGHYEVVEIAYNTSKTSYKVMVEYAWRNIDPTDGKGQFCDRGTSYRPAIFYADDREKEIAEQVKDDILNEYSWTEDDVDGVALLERPTFWKAEEYHQDYYIKKANNYGYYKNACGRKNTLVDVWGYDEYNCYHSLESTCFQTVVNEEGEEVTAEVNVKGAPPEKVGLLPDFAKDILIGLAVVIGAVTVCYVCNRYSRISRNRKELEEGEEWKRDIDTGESYKNNNKVNENEAL